jgi:hypothetical protein
MDISYIIDYDKTGPYMLVDNVKYKRIKVSLALGYLNKERTGFVLPYKGRYGEGYTREYQNLNTSRYHVKEYYVKVGN